MEHDPAFVRDARDRRLPHRILVPEDRPAHRPTIRYRLVIRDAQDAETARALGVPLFPLTDTAVTMLGYPMRFPTILVLPRALRKAVQTHLPIVRFESEAAAARPRLEDIPVALLRFDAIAARAVIERNLDLLDRGYLLKRIYQEDLETEATRVRLQDFLPLPPAGDPLPEPALRRAAAANRPRRMLP